MKANVFGDGRAEYDHAMLSQAFYEGQDYKTLFEDPDRFVVVGRRGTGKSALTYQLQKDWIAKNSRVILVAPTEQEVIGMRPTASLFGETVTRVRAGMKLAWRYAILVEIAAALASNYKHRKLVERNDLLAEHIRRWQAMSGGVTDKLRLTLRDTLRSSDSSEDRIADISAFLSLNKITEQVSLVVEESGQHLVMLIDRLDEGYESDQVGIGIVDGILYAVEDVKNILQQAFRPLVFVRDNILRAIQIEDKDFSRNLEAQVVRLHWDPEELFHLAARRIRAALGVDKENDGKVWNAVTSNELHGRDGFKRCLQLTLYRPRDLISLLNTAYYRARRQNRETLIDDDFRASAKEISINRLTDLSNEYESVFPGVGDYTSRFANLESPRLTVQEAANIIDVLAGSATFAASALQHFRIVGESMGVLSA
ncbi:MAG TPA: ATP-binding protein, partial [Blastocatellia bacterium]|nr:ATP-binding protein [Blastocatellia bacterium]